MQTPKKRKIIFTLILGGVFTGLWITGYQLSVFYHTTVHYEFSQMVGILSSKQCIALALLEFFAVCALLFGLFTILEKVNAKPSFRPVSGKCGGVFWLVCPILMFVCWIPCYAASYPGFYNYDAFEQVPQALYQEVPYSAHHPLLHTLLMGKIIAFGYYHGTDLNDGIALYSVFQMLVCTFVFSYTIFHIKKISGRRWLCIIAFCYYAFFPPVSMFAMSTTKDTLFSVLLQLTVIYLYEMCTDVSRFFCAKWRIFRFFGIALLMCLFRKNGIYALLCVFPFFMLIYKTHRKQIFLLFFSITFSLFLVNKSLILALNAEEGSPEEMLSVPMQQIARVYKDYGKEAFNEEELSYIYAGISEADLLNYNPFLADNIKNYFDYNIIKSNKLTFFNIWVKKGVKYPTSYLRAFLDNTYQAWYPGTSIFSDPASVDTYYFDMNMCAGGYRDSKMPAVLNFYTKIAREIYYQKIPVLRLLFSIGAMFSVAIFTFAYALYRKNYSVLIAILLILSYCLTVFAGPISLVRYYLILFYALPVNLSFCLNIPRKSLL